MAQDQNLAKIDFSAEVDPIVSVVDSIVGSWKNSKLEEYQTLTEDQIDEIKEKIYEYLLSSAFVELLDVKDDNFYDDADFLLKARQISEADELMEYVFKNAISNDKVSLQFTKGLIRGYYDYCAERQIPADEQYKQILNK